MKHLTSWNDLKAYGIEALTGESCAFCMRLLCDLNEDGVALMRAFLGLSADTRLSRNWNSTVDGKPAVASVLLPRELFPVLCRYVLFLENYPLVWQGASTFGLHEHELEHLPQHEHSNVVRNPAHVPGQAQIRDRNPHLASGRVE